MYDKKGYGQNLVVGDRVLMKNVSKRERTGRIQRFCDNEIYKVVPVHKDLLTYQVQPEKGGSKIKSLHCHLLVLCNQLPLEWSVSKNVL